MTEDPEGTGAERAGAGATRPDDSGAAPQPPPAQPVSKPSPSQRLWSLLRWLWSWLMRARIGIISLAALIGAVLFLYTCAVPLIWGPDIRFSATCTNHRIVIAIENKGGRSAMVGPPHFALSSPSRRKDLDLVRYLVDDPGNDQQVDVAANGGRGRLTYANRLDFFSRSESANNACHFALTLDVEGETTEPRNCPCEYQQSNLPH